MSVCFLSFSKPLIVPYVQGGHTGKGTVPVPGRQSRTAQDLTSYSERAFKGITPACVHTEKMWVTPGLYSPHFLGPRHAR